MCKTHEKINRNFSEHNDHKSQGLKAKEGSTLRTLRTAGTDMIPEPIMVVVTLNTVPGIEPGTATGFDPVKRGT